MIDLEEIKKKVDSFYDDYNNPDKGMCLTEYDKYFNYLHSLSKSDDVDQMISYKIIEQYTRLMKLNIHITEGYIRKGKFILLRKPETDTYQDAPLISMQIFKVVEE